MHPSTLCGRSALPTSKQYISQRLLSSLWRWSCLTCEDRRWPQELAGNHPKRTAEAGTTRNQRPEQAEHVDDSASGQRKSRLLVTAVAKLYELKFTGGARVITANRQRTVRIDMYVTWPVSKPNSPARRRLCSRMVFQHAVAAISATFFRLLP